MNGMLDSLSVDGSSSFGTHSSPSSSSLSSAIAYSKLPTMPVICSKLMHSVVGALLLYGIQHSTQRAIVICHDLSSSST